MAIKQCRLVSATAPEAQAVRQVCLVDGQGLPTAPKGVTPQDPWPDQVVVPTRIVEADESTAQAVTQVCVVEGGLPEGLAPHAKAYEGQAVEFWRFVSLDAIPAGQAVREVALDAQTLTIDVTPKTVTLKVGQTADLTATLGPAGVTADVTWTTSDAAVATVAPK